MAFNSSNKQYIKKTLLPLHFKSVLGDKFAKMLETRLTDNIENKHEPWIVWHTKFYAPILNSITFFQRSIITTINKMTCIGNDGLC